MNLQIKIQILLQLIKRKFHQKEGLLDHLQEGKEMNLLGNLDSHLIENQEPQLGAPKMIQEDQIVEMMVIMRMMMMKKKLMRKKRK